jgi:hypothetical protein
LENFHLNNLSLVVKLLIFNVLLVVGGSIGNQLQGVRVMVFNATFNNISVILWWSVLLVEETGADKFYHIA